MVPIKGISLLLDAFASLRDEMPDIRLLLVGDGPSRSELQQQAQDIGVAEAIEWTGLVEDATPYLRQMDLFVLPSLHEGVPVALLEAMAHRVPVVAASVGGVPEVVESGRSGLLIAERNPRVWAGEVRRLLEDPDAAASLAEQAYRVVASRFSVESVAEQYRRAYRNVLEVPRGHSIHGAPI